MKNTSKSQKEGSLSKNENLAYDYTSKFYDNISSFTKHLSNLLIILNGTGAVTVFTKGNNMYNFSLFCFVVGVLSVVISLIFSYGFIVLSSRKFYCLKMSDSIISKCYKNYFLINCLWFIASGFFLFLGLSNGYNVISRQLI